MRQALDDFFLTLGQGVNAHLLIRRHRHELERLNAMTDAELSAMGLTRHGIPAHVFGARYGEIFA